jgi:hypothetical protein
MIQRPKFAANTIFLSLTQDPMAKLLRIRSLSLPSTPRAHKATPHAPGRTRGLLDPPGRFPHRHRPASSHARAAVPAPLRRPSSPWSLHRPTRAHQPRSAAAPDAPPPLMPQDATGAAAAGAGRRQAALLLGSGGRRCVKAPGRSAALLLRPQDAAGAAGAGAGRR